MSKKLLIDGPAEFCDSACWALDVLKSRVPHRYAEVHTYLPKLIYDPRRLRDEGFAHAYARADGYWTQDGKSERTLFLFTIVHATRHNMADNLLIDDERACERDADHYANTVFAEMGWPRGWMVTPDGRHEEIQLRTAGYRIVVPQTPSPLPQATAPAPLPRHRRTVELRPIEPDWWVAHDPWAHTE